MPRRADLLPPARRRVLAVLSASAFLLVTSLAWGLQITGLKGPQSFIADEAGETYYISNVNGDPEERDNNGFITKLDGSGHLVEAQFIRGGRDGVVLHAPKGLALVGSRLYVADLDTVQAFDTASARALQRISLAGFGKVSLADLAHDGHGVLYGSDPDANTIYRIDTTQQHAVSIFLRDPVLAGPKGLAVHPTTGHLVVGSWQKGKILDVDSAGKITELFSNSFFSARFHNLDGVAFDKFGNLYLADTTGGKVWRMRGDQRFDVIAEFLNSPADIGIDRSKHLILVPYAYGDAAEMNGLESPTKTQKQKRTLADYGFGFMDRFKEQQRDKTEQPPVEQK